MPIVNYCTAANEDNLEVSYSITFSREASIGSGFFVEESAQFPHRNISTNHMAHSSSLCVLLVTARRPLKCYCMCIRRYGLG